MTYSDYLYSLREKRINRMFLNSDSEKRKSVYRELLQCADKNLRFFAGNLCDDITNSDDFVEGISDFIEKNGNLEILLNKYDESVIKESNLYKRLAFYAARNYNVTVKSTPVTVNIHLNGKDTPAHFAVADFYAFRLEVDIKKRTAICNMNDEKFSQMLIKTFDKISSDSQTVEIDLVKLFSLKPKKEEHVENS